MNFRSTPIGKIFPQTGLPAEGGPVTTDLPAGYILEYGAQQAQALQPWHQGLVDGAIAHAQQNPIFVFLMPPGGYIGS